MQIYLQYDPDQFDVIVDKANSSKTNKIPFHFQRVVFGCRLFVHIFHVMRRRYPDMYIYNIVLYCGAVN